MAYNEQLADSVRELLYHKEDVTEKEMFNGLCFMVDDKMCICISGTELLCRIGAEQVMIELFSGDVEEPYKYSENYCAGVPLTKEWLIRFGLQVHESFDELFVLNNNFIIDPKTFEVFIDKNVAGKFISINTIKYVHQLQNLYFILTGKELTRSI